MNLAEKYAKFSAENSVQPIGINGKVLLIDGLNTYLRCFSATPTMDDDGRHIGGITGFLLSMGAAIRTHKPTRVVIVFDGKGGSQRRRKLFPEYKSHRRMMTKLNRTYDFNTLDEEQLAMKWQLVKLVELLAFLPVLSTHIENVEADDVIAYLASYVETKGGKSIIMSTDKDFLQLINESTSVWNPAKKKMYREENTVEDYGFHPNNFLLYRAVTGDKSDNIPGVDGIKEKTLIKHFPELASPEKRDIDFLLESARQQIAAKKKPPVVLTKLLESEEQLKLNTQLMRLDDDAEISVSARMKALALFDTQPPKLNKYELTKAASHDKILSAFGRWDDWVISTFAPLNRYTVETKDD
jgi:DNA polymerase-1